MPEVRSTWKGALSLLEILGLYTKTKTRKVMAFTVLYSLLFVFTEAMVSIQFLYIEGDVYRFIYNFEALNVYGQALTKVIIVAYNQEQLIQILNNTKSFWKTDVCKYDVKADLDTLAANIMRLQKTFLYCVSVAVSGLIFSAIVDKSLPLGIWNLQGYELLYKITLVVQILVVVFIIVFIAGFDCLFLTLSTDLFIQFKILCHCLENLNFSISEPFENKYAKIKSYIQHHIFLLRFAELLQNYFSVAMLMECLTISPAICAEMYIMFKSNSINILISRGIILFSMTLQLSFYCFIAEFISSQASKLSDSIYSSDWYSNYFPSLRVPITLIILRSQNTVIFKGGGLFQIDLKTLVGVLRVSWSLCTLMRALE